MRRWIPAVAAACLLTAPACSDDATEGGVAEDSVPEFGADDHTNRPLESDREGGRSVAPPDAAVTSLSIDGDALPLEGGACVSPNGDPEAVEGFQAVVTGRGTLEVRLDGAAQAATAVVQLDGQTTEYDDLTVERVNDVWYLQRQATAEEVEPGEDETSVQITFHCLGGREGAIDDAEPEDGQNPQNEDLAS